jgi:hypothetical protein
MNIPHYENYSTDELYEILNHISKSEFPLNYQRLLTELNNRKLKTANKMIPPNEILNAIPKKERERSEEPVLNSQQIKNCGLVAYIFFLNAIIIMAQFLFFPSTEITMYLTTAIIDIICGLLLLLSPSKVIVTIVVIRSVFALILFVIKDLAGSQFEHLFLQVIYSGSIIFLLTKTPEKLLRNLAVGITIIIQIFILGSISSSAIIHSNLDRIYALGQYEVREIKGVFYEYQLKIDSENWYLRERDSALKDNPLVEQWVVNPEFDAHILVIGEKISRTLNMDLFKFRDNVISNAEKASSQFKKIEEFATTSVYSGLIIHSKAKINFIDIEFLHGLYIMNDDAFQIVAFCKSENFEIFEKDFIKVINSFQYSKEVTDIDRIRL